MIEYFGSDKKRIHHFLKVYSFAKTIGESENLLPDDQELLEISAIVHKGERRKVQFVCRKVSGT